jgi:hypothetical protein
VNIPSATADEANELHASAKQEVSKRTKAEVTNWTKLSEAITAFVEAQSGAPATLVCCETTSFINSVGGTPALPMQDTSRLYAILYSVLVTMPGCGIG